MEEFPSTAAGVVFWRASVGAFRQRWSASVRVWSLRAAAAQASVAFACAFSRCRKVRHPPHTYHTGRMCAPVRRSGKCSGATVVVVIIVTCAASCSLRLALSLMSSSAAAAAAAAVVVSCTPPIAEWCVTQTQYKSLHTVSAKHSTVTPAPLPPSAVGKQIIDYCLFN